jgi:hypothetical protein
MSQIARLFVVLNLLLAAGFLYAAAMFLGLNHDWKKKHETLTKELAAEKEDARKQIAAQKTRIDDLSRESQTVKEERSNLTGKNDQLTKTLADLDRAKKEGEAALAKEQGLVASANENLKRANDELSKRTAEADKLRADFATAQANERKANEALEKSQGDVRTRDNSIAELEKVKTELTAKNEELEIMKKVAQDAGVDLSNLMSKAPIPNAQVIGVDMEMKLVQVNAGTTQKVSRGAMLDIVRGSNYIGRIKIDQVYPNSAAGTIQVLSPGASVQVGDRATNTIN